MAVEALNGNEESFATLIHDLRPHPGQIEAASNIKNILKTSRLTTSHVNYHSGSSELLQDRYALRTSPQWIGPHIETLKSIYSTLRIELNSVTDNPLICLDTSKIYHGGNFQATSVAHAMDCIRISLQAIGKLLFAQHCEVVNKDFNNHLPANLCFGEPNIDFGYKGVDISMASYMAELSWLASPVTIHAQSAELHNQSVNSMAFVSARQSAKSVELLRMMVACHLYSLTQAIDLRSIQKQFIDKLTTEITSSITKLGLDGHNAEICAYACLENQNVDIRTRCTLAFTKFVAQLLAQGSIVDVDKWNRWIKQMVSIATQIHEDVHLNYEDGSAVELMGSTRHLYEFLRCKLKIGVYRGRNGHHGDKLQKIFDSITNEDIVPALLKCFDCGEE